MKFYFLLRKNAAEVVLMLIRTYKDDTIGNTEVYKWFVQFKNGDMSIDKPHSGSHHQLETCFTLK